MAHWSDPEIKKKSCHILASIPSNSGPKRPKMQKGSASEHTINDKNLETVYLIGAPVKPWQTQLADDWFAYSFKKWSRKW